MVFVYFFLAAAVTVYTAIKLSQFADVIDNKTEIGGALTGTLLLAGATSLPEVTTSISAVIIGNPDIAVGNLLGSNLFNLFILSSLDLYFRRKQLYSLSSRKHIYTAGLGLFLTTMVLLAFLLKIDYTIIGIGVDALLISIAYGVGMMFISKLHSPQTDETSGIIDTSTKEATEKSSTTVKQSIVGFTIAALVIMGAGTVLSIMGDKIALVTGLGSSFVGSFLIAATTSLPEAVSVVTALRLKNVNMAIGSILGSNMFNMLILAGSDIFYQEGSILVGVSSSHLITTIGITILSLILIFALVRKQSKTVWRYIVPSFLIIVGYMITSYWIFLG